MKYTDSILFNDGWLFRKTNSARMEQVAINEYGFSPVTLPHDWQITNKRDPEMENGRSQGFYPRYEVGWYRKHFTAQENWQGKTIYLLLDGCMRFYDIYLNGEIAGGHRYGYVPYLLNITDKLSMGKENLFAIKVNNSDTLGDRWYSGAGLYRDAHLLVKNPVHILPFSLKTEQKLCGEQAQLSISVTLSKTDETALTAVATLQNKDGYIQKVQTSVSDTDVHLTIDIDEAHRWDIDDPFLYDLTVQIMSNGAIVDTVYEKIGFRESYFDGDKGYFLNGRMRKLYGADLHHDGGVCFGAAVPEGVLRRRLLKLRDLGCNAIRCSHNPHQENLYDLCDELGLVVIDELYDKWNDTDLYFDKLYFEDRMIDLQMMVTRDRNHPCVILWSVGNELEIQYLESFYTELQEMCDACRKLDPTRPVSLALIGFCINGFDDASPLEKRMNAAVRYSEIVDVLMGNYIEQFYVEMRKAGMKKAIIGSEVFTYFRLAEGSNTTTVIQSPWLDVKNKEYVAGGFIWAGVDYLGESGPWPSKGWTGSAIDSAGFLKLRCEYLRSQWSDKPMIQVGIYDDSAYDDYAPTNWAFPLMIDCWHASREGLMRHVAVMSNCEKVVLRLNNEHPRILTQKAPDDMFHCMIPYCKGELLAEGYINGELVATQKLVTPDQPKKLSMQLFDEPTDDPRKVFHAELALLDGNDQIWTLSSPDAHVEVYGAAEIAGIDNGDFMDEHDAHGNDCPFHLGHIVLYLRAKGKGKFTIKATCDEMCCTLHSEI